MLPEVDSAVSLELRQHFWRIVLLYQLDVVSVVQDYSLTSVIDGCDPLRIV